MSARPPHYWSLCVHDTLLRNCPRCKVKRKRKIIHSVQIPVSASDIREALGHDTDAVEEASAHPPDFKHCDDYIHSFSAPECLRWFLFVHRLPATDAALVVKRTGEPKLFADWTDGGATHTVRITMASRLGDVGISKHLESETGYFKRVTVAELANFRETP